MNFSSLPTPDELMRQFEAGDISREELQATMALHARDLIKEMVDEHENPIKAYMERLRNQLAVKKLSRKHGSALLREVLAAMGRMPDFPPAHLLWNANHQQMPLHCFVRMKIEPIFRITKLEQKSLQTIVKIEYGEKVNMTKEELVFQRDPQMQLQAIERRVI